MHRVEDYSSGRSSSSTGSFTSYATLPTMDYGEVIATCDNNGQKLLLVPDSLSMENNAASTATLECGGGRRGSRGGGVLHKTMSFSGSSGGSGSVLSGRDEEEDDDCDRDSSSSSSMGADEDNKSGGCSSDYSMEDCDITIVDDTSFNKRSSGVPKNEAELMFLQVVEILRFEKKVNHRTN